MPFRPNRKFNFFYLGLAILGVLFLRDLWVGFSTVSSIPYDEFQRLLKEKQIEEVVISDRTIEGKLKTPLSDGRKMFVTNRVESDLADKLGATGVKYRRAVQNTLFRDLLSWVIPIFLFFAIWAFLMRRAMGGKGGFGGQFLSIGKSKAKVYMETDTKVTFKDVAGVDEAKEELKETVAFLKDPKGQGRLGGRLPKGVLLIGPPGTGKTLLAKAVAGEASAPFFSISGSEFVEMFVGVGAARVRDLFEQARQKAPCIIFIDELDALGRARTASPLSGGHDEKEQTLNQLLVEMDGFDSSSGIVILAATNRPEILDPALLRAGRFDRQVLVDRPDKKGRVAILQVHIGKVKIDPALDLEKVAALTPGFTGADLANLVNEAALVATRRNGDFVTLNDFTIAMERIVAGLEKKNRVLNVKERETVAYHEMGHALVAATLPNTDAVHKVSIIARGIGALGYTLQRPTEDRYIMTREELENKMTVLLGGRASELIIFDELSTGAADDISKATDIARNMVTRFGMDPTLGSIAYDTEPTGMWGAGGPVSQRQYSEESSQRIDEALRRLVTKASERASAILRHNLSLLHEGAKLLLTKETLDDTELKPIFSRVSLPPNVRPIRANS